MLLDCSAWCTIEMGSFLTQSLTIMIVDDDPDITNLLEVYLSEEGYEVVVAHTAQAMWELLDSQTIDLILLDIMLPDGDGFDLTRKLRETLTSPLIILSRKSDSIDQIVGLELGADDYVTKPLEPRNLLARIRSLLRRTNLNNAAQPAAPAAGDKHIRFAEWSLDAQTHRLTHDNGDEFTLSANEAELLYFLASNSGQVLSRNDLSVAVSGREWEYMDRSIDILIARLRKRIEREPAEPEFIQTVRGKGYVFSNSGNN